MGMDTVELIMKIEDHFKIIIPDKEAERITTVKDIYEVVRKHLHDRPGLPPAGTEEAIDSIIAIHAGFDLKDITPHQSITNDLGLD